MLLSAEEKMFLWLGIGFAMILIIIMMLVIGTLGVKRIFSSIWNGLKNHWFTLIMSITVFFASGRLLSVWDINPFIIAAVCFLGSCFLFAKMHKLFKYTLAKPELLLIEFSFIAMSVIFNMVGWTKSSTFYLSLGSCFIALAVGVVFWVFWFIARYESNLSEKLLRVLAIAITVITIGSGLLLPYIWRTELVEGDYPNQSCTHTGCENAVKYKFIYKTDKYFYCENHDCFYTEILYGKDTYDYDEVDVLIIAEKVVKEKLKAPSTAKFSKITETQISHNENTWTVKGYVDAENSFGVVLRKKYEVTITFASSSSYTVDYCSIY